MATTHAWVEHSEAGKIECRRDIQCVWFDVVLPGSGQDAIRVDFLIAASQAVLKQPLDHVGFGEKFSRGGYLRAGHGLTPPTKFGVDTRFGLFLVELVGPADSVRVGKGSIRFGKRKARYSTSDKRHAAYQCGCTGTECSCRVIQGEESRKCPGLRLAGILKYCPASTIRSGCAPRVALAQDEESFGKTIVIGICAQGFFNQPAG